MNVLPVKFHIIYILVLSQIKVHKYILTSLVGIMNLLEIYIYICFTLVIDTCFPSGNFVVTCNLYLLVLVVYINV